jgi:hypothetical protein
VAITGLVRGTLDFGGGALARPSNAGSYYDTYVAKLDPAGNQVFAKAYDPSAATCTSNAGSGGCLFDPIGVAIAPNGDVAVAAQFVGSVDFGAGARTATKGKALYLELSGTGGHVWSQAYGSDGAGQAGFRVRFDTAGNLFLLGRSPPNSSFDLGNGVAVAGGVGDFTWLAKLDASKSAQWARLTKPAANTNGISDGQMLALDHAGNVVIVGSFAGDADFGDGTLTATGLTPFVAKYASSNGAFLVKRTASRTFVGNPGAMSATGAIDSIGGTLLAGWLTGSADFGGGPMTAAGYEVYFARFEP